MSISSSTNAALLTVWRVVGLGLLASIAVVSAEAQQQFRPAPKFAGKAIPEPPAQGRPWTAPATRLPRFLLDATAALFEQGVADPRDCAYHHVEVGDVGIVKTRGFVLPERADAPGRFVVCWDGLVHPALNVGEPADLDGEVKELAAQLRQARENAQPNRGRDAWHFPRSGQNFGAAGVDEHASIKLCFLIRLGRADLAETLFGAATSWTPESRPLTSYGISYLTLANDWAGSEFVRLAGAHMRGDDVTALDAARRLAKFRDMASARAEAMGFPPGNRQGRFSPGGAPSPWFSFLDQLDDLLRDQERRAKEPPRTPVPPRGGDPTTRIAALIRDLDQIDEQQMMFPGGAHPGGSPLVGELIAEGDPAVAPLLEVLESDDRLTRSVSVGRGFSVGRLVHPVYEPAFSALVGILKTGEFANRRPYRGSNDDPAARKALADSMRQFWEKTRAIPLTERWYRTLLDDAAEPARWLEAAGEIVRPELKQGRPTSEAGPHPMQGASLRVGRDPSVTDLMLRRARQIDRTGAPSSFHDPGFASACQMAFCLASWDEKASLPLLKELSKECRARSEAWRKQPNQDHADQNLGSSMARFTQIRVRLGDAQAVGEYAEWLRTTTPKLVEYGRFEALKPLLEQPDHPALASAARWLFNDPKSPWVPLLPEARGQQAHFQNHIATPLVVVAGYREGLIAGLADKTLLGSVTWGEDGFVEYKINNVPGMKQGGSNLDMEGVKVGEEHPFRNCDYLALKLSDLDGCPRFDLFWPENRRDRAVAACAAYLKRFGDRFTTESPPGMHDFPHPKGHLAFPILKRPASRDEVAAGRAIFSLEGEGETRVVDLPGGLPQKARWTTLKDSPYIVTDQNGPHRTYRTDGHVWQVEEVRKGDVWERWYGFVGQHTVGRAPASEIELMGGVGR